jgi:hypothetical protein
MYPSADGCKFDLLDLVIAGLTGIGIPLQAIEAECDDADDTQMRNSRWLAFGKEQRSQNIGRKR